MLPVVHHLPIMGGEKSLWEPVVMDSEPHTNSWSDSFINGICNIAHVPASPPRKSSFTQYYRYLCFQVVHEISTPNQNKSIKMYEILRITFKNLYKNLS